MGKDKTAETFSEEKAIEELTLTLRDLYQRGFNDGFAAAERLHAADNKNPAGPVPDGESVAAVVQKRRKVKNEIVSKL